MEFKIGKENEFVRKMVREFEKEQMSNEEAISTLSKMKAAHESLYTELKDEYFRKCARALDIAIRAVSLQIAKEPIDRIAYKECPTCGHVDITPLDVRCERCSQMLDWREKKW